MENSADLPASHVLDDIGMSHDDPDSPASQTYELSSTYIIHIPLKPYHEYLHSNHFHIPFIPIPTIFLSHSSP